MSIERSALPHRYPSSLPIATSGLRRRCIPWQIQLFRSVALLGMFVAFSARAWVTSPVLDPVRPKPGERVYVTFSSGYCDGFGVPQVIRSGTYVRFVISGAHSTDYDFCNYETLDRRYLLGSFQPGIYVVQVDRTFIGDDGIETHPMGTLNLIVAAPSSLSIPALDLASLVGLAAALVAIAIGRRRARR